MKKLLLLFVTFAGLQVAAQQTLFEDSFEFYDNFAITGVGEWTLIDIDLKNTYGIQDYAFDNSGVEKSFQVFNATATMPPLTASATSDWSARSGSKNMVCFSAVPSATVLANNDWMISPQISLAASGNTLKFWAKCCDAIYGAERFRVGVSVTDTAPSSFVLVTPGAYLITPQNVTYQEYTYNLDLYANQNVYIGFNCISNDQFGFAIDDVSVTADLLGTENFFANNFLVYPNPANATININSKYDALINKVQLFDLNGRLLKTIESVETIHQLNIADLNDGVYALKVSSSQGVGTTRIIKK